MSLVKVGLGVDVAANTAGASRSAKYFIVWVPYSQYTRVMDPIVGASLAILMRWLHIISVITAIGGLLYASLVMSPTLSSLPLESRTAFAAAINNRFRPLLRLAIFFLIVSGIYNLVTKANLPPGYHIWFGIKMLLALHVIAVSFLLSSSSVSQERRTRMTTGVVISGGVIVLLSAYLRFLSNWMQS